MFLPTKSAACNALDEFLPRAGRDYATGRNYDTGPDSETTVSRLSPWIRVRLLPEWEVVAAVLAQHSQSAASKFIDEVCWRTYWKGWLQLRPGAWHNYRDDLAQLLEAFQAHSGYQKAIAGRTGIECFDTWNAELLEHNYLHNHARMWYASIWIHTLKLPWQLGADWFLRHLLDGDPASNTLSWRWVAGAHTRGKTYLARPRNIQKYTNDRFQVEESLAIEPTIGHWPEVLQTLRTDLAIHGIEVYTTRHWWDATLFPHATKGFFHFKKSIPGALKQL